jgi:hypothetical protein
MRPEPGEVLHFSEDPAITRFEPHVAVTAQVPGAYVWAVDHARAPDYWFPRLCPRAMVWREPGTSEGDRLRLLGPAATRVHVVEYGWLTAMRTVELYAYRFAADGFAPICEPPHAHVATVPVLPLGPPRRVGDLFELHEQAGIELRAVANLWPYWDAVVGSTVGYSGIRLRHAKPRPDRPYFGS